MLRQLIPYSFPRLKASSTRLLNMEEHRPGKGIFLHSLDSPVAAAADVAAGMGLQGSAVRNGMLRLRGMRGRDLGEEDSLIMCWRQIPFSLLAWHGWSTLDTLVSGSSAGPEPPHCLFTSLLEATDLQTLRCLRYGGCRCLWYGGCRSSLRVWAGHQPLHKEPEGQGGPQLLSCSLGS